MAFRLLFNDFECGRPISAMSLVKLLGLLRSVDVVLYVPVEGPLVMLTSTFETPPEVPALVDGTTVVESSPPVTSESIFITGQVYLVDGQFG